MAKRLPEAMSRDLKTCEALLRQCGRDPDVHGWSELEDKVVGFSQLGYKTFERWPFLFGGTRRYGFHMFSPWQIKFPCTVNYWDW